MVVFFFFVEEPRLSPELLISVKDIACYSSRRTEMSSSCLLVVLGGSQTAVQFSGKSVGHSKAMLLESSAESRGEMMQKSASKACCAA